MSKRKPQRPKQISRSGRRGFWILTGLAVVTALAAMAFGVTLVPHQRTLDNKVFFVIGAGLSAIVLLLVAQVWRHLTSGR